MRRRRAATPRAAATSSPSSTTRPRGGAGAPARTHGRRPAAGPPPAEAGVDPQGDGNLFSFYYDSPLWVDGRTCSDVRTATGCGLAADGGGPFSALAAAGP